MATNLHIISAPISHPSSLQSTLHTGSPVSSNPRYLQQRIKELEQELENKRIELFQSEEARLEVEARLMGKLETPTTTVATSLKQIDFGGVEKIDEWLSSKGEYEGMSSARKHHVHSPVLHHDLRISSL